MRIPPRSTLWKIMNSANKLSRNEHSKNLMQEVRLKSKNLAVSPRGTGMWSYPLKPQSPSCLLSEPSDQKNLCSMQSPGAAGAESLWVFSDINHHHLFVLPVMPDLGLAAWQLASPDKDRALLGRKILCQTLCHPRIYHLIREILI